MKQDITTLYNELKEIQAQKKDLEKQEKLVKDLLCSLIPENTEKSGLYHSVTTGKSISYAKVYTDLLNIIPKTKYKEAEKIKQRHTSEYPKHTIKEAKK